MRDAIRMIANHPSGPARLCEKVINLFFEKDLTWAKIYDILISFQGERLSRS